MTASTASAASITAPSPGAFARLRDLLHDVSPPAGTEPLDLHLGEPRLDPSALPLGPMTDPDGWARYPPLGGTAELRDAYTAWLGRRFGVRQGLHDGRVAVEPTPGTKQALAVTVASAVAAARSTADPAVILPNPYYPTYRAAAAAAGARPVFYAPAGGDAVPSVVSALHAAGGSAAAVVVCNPGNPRGEVLPAPALREIAEVTAAARAVLVVDECYTDLCIGQVPPGYLSLVERGIERPGPFAVLHSLSKRSGAPGLRSGFLAGDPATVAAYAAYNRACGVSTPLPVCAVATALWSDDARVARLQSALARNWDLADAILGGLRCYRRADAGLFLWLPVPDDEGTARRLWRDHALSVMPGRYLSVRDEHGTDPGVGHVRIALVHDAARMREALTRLRAAMTGDASRAVRDEELTA
jgi:N-succinyldiaminopimelate aminotransferase